MAGPATVANADAVLKDLYDGGRLVEMGYEKDPLFGLLPKKSDFTGRKIVTPIGFAKNQSLSADFATGQAILGYNRWDAWEATPVEYFAFATFDRAFLKQVKKGDGAFVEGLKSEMDGTIEALLSELCFQLYGGGLGVRGQISSGSNTGTATITLADTSKIVLFDVGMHITASPNADGTSMRTGSVDITKVNRGAGELTASGNWSTGITSCAASDYLYRKGDHAAGLHGLQTFIPATAPTTSLQGVDRSVDPERLGGVRMGCLGKTVEESIVDMAAQVGIVGGANPGKCFLNYKKWVALEKELMSRGIRYVDVKTDIASIGYSGIRVKGPKGDIDVLSSAFCPLERGYLLQMDTWKLVSAGDMPELFSEDGNTILRQATANRYEARMGWLGQLTCNAPGKNGVMLFDTAP